MEAHRNIQMAKETCAKCNTTIMGVGVDAGGGTWYHDRCFTCGKCGKVIDNSADGFQRSLGTNYHPACFRAATSTNCPKCNRAIEGGKVVAAEGVKYHKECFVCSTAGCRVPMSNGYMVHTDGKPYCAKCADNFSTTTTVQTGELVRGIRVNPRTGERTTVQTNTNPTIDIHSPAYTTSTTKTVAVSRPMITGPLVTPSSSTVATAHAPGRTAVTAGGGATPAAPGASFCPSCGARAGQGKFCSQCGQQIRPN